MRKGKQCERYYPKIFKISKKAISYLWKKGKTIYQKPADAIAGVCRGERGLVLWRADGRVRNAVSCDIGVFFRSGWRVFVSAVKNQGICEEVFDICSDCFSGFQWVLLLLGVSGLFERTGSAYHV